jgi:hypothetical protein
MAFRSVGRFWIPILTAVMVCGAWAPALAQGRIAAADIQRLQDRVYDVSSEISRLRSSDAGLTMRLQAELDDLRDEVIYLKVKLRKEGSVTAAEYNDVRDRLEELRARASGRTTSRVERDTRYDPAPPPTTRTTPERSAPNTVPVGTELDVRLQTRLSSSSAEVEDRFEATTMVDLYQDDRTLIPAGSVLRGVVSSVDRASRTDRRGSLTLTFDQITVNGRSYPLRATVVNALESEGIRGEAGRIGTGAGVGAIIGGILGGVKGALIGILVGAGGTIAATEGKDVTLEQGTVLRVRLDSPLTVR